jgi:hypothetical protein
MFLLTASEHAHSFNVKRFSKHFIKKTYLGRFLLGTVEQGLEEAAHGSEPEGEKKRRDRQEVTRHGEAQHLPAKH